MHGYGDFNLNMFILLKVLLRIFLIEFIVVMKKL